MTTPASIQAREQLFAKLQAASARSWFNGRSDEEPIQSEERPAGVLRVVRVAMDTDMGGGETLHNMDFEIDLYDEEALFGDIAATQEIAVSAIQAAVAADPELGGRVIEVRLTGRTASPESVPDVGVMTITGTVLFRTPENDFNTLIGPGGQFT